MPMHIGLNRLGRRRLPVIAALTAALIVTTSPASAQTALPDTPEAFGAVFRSWAAKFGVEQGFVVVRRDGRIVHRTAVGGANSRAVVPLASLSKAITGACIATLVRDGKLTFDAPMSTALANFAKRTGELNPRFRNVTVAQLLTHRAGFDSRKDDPGSGQALGRYLQTHAATERPSPEFLAQALSQDLIHDPGTTFGYSNTGYLALGLVIEQASGERYAPFCRQAVLAPLGVTGELYPDWRVLWSFAGWSMTADDYLRFLDIFTVEDRRLGAVAKDWMLDPGGKTVSANGEMWYGLGTYLRKGDQGVNLRHFGSWADRKRSILTLAVRQSDGTAWFVFASPRPRAKEEQPGMKLERELLAAYRGVKTWN